VQELAFKDDGDDDSFPFIVLYSRQIRIVFSPAFFSADNGLDIFVIFPA